LKALLAYFCLVRSRVQGRDEDERRWKAVLARDMRFDGRFVFGVRSTGIYCRPSCPARRPRRDRVVFFEAPEAAEGAGFRSCRRCRPRDDSSARTVWVSRVCRYIDAHLDVRVSLADLAREVELSRHHLQREFKRTMGVTPRQYADARRLGTFKSRLREGEAVTASIYEAGYGSSSRLYESASVKLGMTPATYRRGGLGMHMGYTIVDSPLGRLLVAATERGISAVSLGRADNVLEAALREEYPAAEISRDDVGLELLVEGVLSRLKGREPDAFLPIDIVATAFQRRVWEALQAIPRGSTRSYSQIATSLGRPRAARAVARACATNPVAVVIPCHRVVAGDGSLAGYRWGVAAKRALLNLEGAPSPEVKTGR
jgi:AraC family transcriptional regulator of adaptative response/methylated-DNA-[protein]-cysteine methyltransferase